MYIKAEYVPIFTPTFPILYILFDFMVCIKQLVGTWTASIAMSRFYPKREKLVLSTLRKKYAKWLAVSGKQNKTERRKLGILQKLQI